MPSKEQLAGESYTVHANCSVLPHLASSNHTHLQSEERSLSAMRCFDSLETHQHCLHSITPQQGNNVAAQCLHLKAFLGYPSNSRGHAGSFSHSYCVCSIFFVSAGGTLLPATQPNLCWDNHSQCCCSVFFVGYTVTNVCGGYLAARYTAKLVLGLGVLSYSIFTILMPVAASSNSVYVVLACACLMGAGEGVIFPAMQHLQGKWLPPNRRTFANTLLFAGAVLFCNFTFTV